MRSLMLPLFVFLVTLSFASDSTIVFRDIAYEDVFSTAAEEEKPVLLYFHFDGCSACRKMEKTTFKDPQVESLFNKNFVCFEINTKKGKGIEINKDYEVRLHPTFLFLDPEGNPLHKIIGYYKPADFIRHANRVLDPEGTLSYYRDEFRSGNRDEEFLYEYCYLLRDAFELDSLTIQTYLSTQSDKELAEEKNIRFIYEFAMHQYDVNMPYESRPFQFMLNNQALFDRYFDPDQVDARLSWIMNRAIYQAADKQDRELFDRLAEDLKEFDTGEKRFFKEMDGRITGVMGKHIILPAEMYFHEQAGDEVKYQTAFSKYITLVWDDPEELNNLAWQYYLEETDPEKLKKALTWAERSVSLDNAYNNNDTWAALLFKTGQLDKALARANKAVEIAEKNGQNASGTIELIDKIKKAKNEDRTGQK